MRQRQEPHLVQADKMAVLRAAGCLFRQMGTCGGPEQPRTMATVTHANIQMTSRSFVKARSVWLPATNSSGWRRAQNKWGVSDDLWWNRWCWPVYFMWNLGAKRFWEWMCLIGCGTRVLRCLSTTGWNPRCLWTGSTGRKGVKPVYSLRTMWHSSVIGCGDFGSSDQAEKREACLQRESVIVAPSSGTIK